MAADSEAVILTPQAIWTAQSTGCQFLHVYDLDHDRLDNVVLADYRNNRVCKISPEGKMLSSFTPINSAHGLVVDKDDNFIITNYRGNTVEKFNSEGKSILKWGKEGTGNGEFVGSVSAAINTAGEIFVADYHNHRIQKFDSKGKFIKTWGSLGIAQGQLNLPHAVALGPDGLLYVADRKNSRIQVFDGDGNFIRILDAPGSEPQGVEVDSKLNVYVADMASHQVFRFGPSGKIEKRFGRKGTGPGEFDIPLNVRIDSKGRVYIPEQGNARIQVFSLEDLQS